MNLIMIYECYQDFLGEAIERYAEFVTNSHYWLGMDDTVVEGDWRWVDHTHIDPQVR